MNSTNEKKIFRLRESLSKNKIDTVIILIEENRRYLSGFTGEDTQFDESAGALFINENKLILATDSRYDLQAKKEAPLFEIYCYKKGLSKEMGQILKGMHTKRLGFESMRMSYSQYKKINEQFASEKLDIELVGADDILETIRIRKEESEIDMIRKSLSLAESVFNYMLPEIKPGMIEKDAAWMIERGLREAGAESVSFPAIVASGPNSALPHAIPENRKFKKGEPILFDWGARLNGYCSDISRTLVIGKPDDTFIKVFTTVYDAQRMAIDAIKAGVSSKSVDDVARKHIEGRGFKGKFGHGLGHGVGLAIHEPPRIGPLKDTTLEEGMVFTVEPGIYLPGWGGIRLENMVVVRKDHAEVLNNTDCLNNRIGV